MDRDQGVGRLDPPLTASGLRFAIAFPLLALIVARTKGVSLRYPRGQGRLLALVTLAYFAAPYALMNVGGRAMPSGLAAVLFATVSIFIVARSVPLLGAAISGREAAGVGVALAALAALIAKQSGISGGANPLGVLALLAAAGLHALVYVLLKRDAGAIDPLTLNALPMGPRSRQPANRPGPGACLPHVVSSKNLCSVNPRGAVGPSSMTAPFHIGSGSIRAVRASARSSSLVSVCAARRSGRFYGKQQLAGRISLIGRTAQLHGTR